MRPNASRRWNAGEEGTLMLDEICREGVRTMLPAALKADVDA